VLSSESATDNKPVKASVIYWRLLGYVKPYWVMFSLGIVGFLIFAATQPALAMLMEYLINAINAGDRDSRWVIPFLLVAIYLVRGLGSFLGNYGLARVAFGVVHTLRKSLFDHLVHLPGHYFDNQNSGVLISRITFDVSQVTQASTDALKVIVREGATIIALLGFLLWKDWKLTSIFLVIGPLLGLVVMVVSKRLRKLSTRIQMSMGNITHVSSEMIHNYQVMRNFGGETYEKTRFSDASYKNYRQNLKRVTLSAMATPVVQVIVALALGCLMFVALTYMDISDAGSFVAYITAATLIPKPLRQLTDVVNKVQKGIAAADSIFEQLDQQPEQDQGDCLVERVSGELRFEQLNFTYAHDEPNVLSDINLSVNPGQVIALVGRSGSGKTTLVNLLLRFYDYEQGDILLDGVSLNRYTLSCLRQQIALVNQSVTLFNDTVYNNIAYGDMADADEAQVIEAAKQAYAWEFIQALPKGMQTLIGENGTRLSGGQRQRLAIARALLKDAPVLILDEATSALDNESERYIQSALEHVMAGRTTLVIAHRLSTIENADSIVVMDKGQIVEQGTHTALLQQQGLYAKLHAQGFDDNNEAQD